MILETIKGYKNAIIGVVAVALFVAYSVFLWRTAGNVKENDFNKERLELQAKVAAEKDRRTEIGDVVGKAIEAKLALLDAGKLAKEIRREIDKNPIYASCRNTPDVLRKLNESRDSANKATGK